MSHFLSFAKGALAMFWLVALVNLAYPLGELHRPILLLSGLLVLVHAAEILLLNGRSRRARHLAGAPPGAAVRRPAPA